MMSIPTRYRYIDTPSPFPVLPNHLADDKDSNINVGDALPSIIVNNSTFPVKCQIIPVPDVAHQQNN